MSLPSPLPALQFVHTELHELSEEKSHRFHETHQAITSEDLWQSWHENKGEGSAGNKDDVIEMCSIAEQDS